MHFKQKNDKKVGMALLKPEIFIYEKKDHKIHCAFSAITLCCINQHNNAATQGKMKVI